MPLHRAACFFLYIVAGYWLDQELDGLLHKSFNRLMALANEDEPFVFEWIGEDQIKRNILIQIGELICLKATMLDDDPLPAPKLRSPLEMEMAKAITQYLAGAVSA